MHKDVDYNKDCQENMDTQDENDSLEDDRNNKISNKIPNGFKDDCKEQNNFGKAEMNILKL